MGGAEVLEEGGGEEGFGMVADPDDGVAGGPDDGVAGVPDDGVAAGADDGVAAGADDDVAGWPEGGADVLGWAGEAGASCGQAAMTTRLPAGSALPPTPLRSTK